MQYDVTINLSKSLVINFTAAMMCSEECNNTALIYLNENGVLCADKALVVFDNALQKLSVMLEPVTLLLTIDEAEQEGDSLHFICHNELCKAELSAIASSEPEYPDSHSSEDQP